MTDQLSIYGIDKARLLASLYNHARVQGYGNLQHDNQEQMHIGSALKIWNGMSERGATYFDYLQGRVMKVELGGDMFDPMLYDRDNGDGQARIAIARARQGFYERKERY